VFDGAGAIVLSITAIGPSATFDTDWNGALAQALRRTADQLSRRLGWQPPRAA
jgi:DNA-binding IclR family transcriptional regulator